MREAKVVFNRGRDKNETKVSGMKDNKGLENHRK